MNLDWGDHRKVRWTRLCAEMLGGEQYVGTLTALLNLDWRNSTQERDIPEEDLRGGLAEYVWPLLTELRPRLVCPLTNRVWETIRPAVLDRQEAFPQCPMSLSRDPIVFRLEGAPFLSFFVKPHNHPSRFLRNSEIEELGKACQWFFTEAPQ